MLRTKARKAMTLQSPGIDLIREPIKLFILGIVLIDRRGLRILNILKTLSPFDLVFGKKSKILTHTTKKSSQFHPSRK